MRNIFLDTETTGLKVQQGHRIVEVAAIACVDRTIQHKSAFHCYFNPGRGIMDEGAVKIHGITEDFLSGQPAFADKVDDLVSFLSGARVHIHNAEFDTAFLNWELKLANRPPLEEIAGAIVDTLAMARRQFPSGGNSIDGLCKRFGIDASHRQKHGALLDATLLAEIYLAMTRGQTSFADLDLDRNQDMYGVPPKEFDAGKYGIKVVRADPEEVKAHDIWISELRESSGVDLWKSDA